MMTRYFLFQGLELHTRNDCAVKHLYLTLGSEAERDTLYESLLSQERTCLEDEQQSNLTLLWQNRHISNFEYLQHLNRCAHLFEILLS